MSEYTELDDIQKLQEQVTSYQNAPVIDMIIRFDARSNKVDVSFIGGAPNGDLAHAMLDAARKYVRRMELEAIRQEKKSPD